MNNSDYIYVYNTHRYTHALQDLPKRVWVAIKLLDNHGPPQIPSHAMRVNRMIFWVKDTQHENDNDP